MAFELVAAHLSTILQGYAQFTSMAAIAARANDIFAEVYSIDASTVERHREQIHERIANSEIQDVEQPVAELEGLRSDRAGALSDVRGHIVTDEVLLLTSFATSADDHRLPSPWHNYILSYFRYRNESKTTEKNTPQNAL